MAIPTEQKENLRDQLAFHKGRLDSLREQISFMQREIHVHELVLTLLDNEAVLKVLDDLTDDPDETARACQDVHGYATARGIKIPSELAVAVTQGDEGPEILVTRHDDLHPFELRWDRLNGFRAHRPERPSASREEAVP